jgi:hypothetical protein
MPPHGEHRNDDADAMPFPTCFTPNLIGDSDVREFYCFIVISALVDFTHLFMIDVFVG